MNKALFVGRLTKDPEVKGNGEKVTIFTVAITRPFFNKENVREADFVQIKAFRKLGENCATWLQKGSLVAVEATVRTGSYERNGQKIYTTDFIAEAVQFLAGTKTAEPETGTTKNNGRRATRNGNSGGGYPPAYGDGYQPYFPPDDPFDYGAPPIDISDDDLPF
ncbi:MULTISPECIES: single-stranded DNA-binding protein [Bacillales]|uniref:single-stranded DNA-binding protein n=1 Tax=Bacillales TaxID=1385 RepID=UPI000779E965|nr:MULTISPECIES: single-stranded DNA-binding protein [Bacillaceae]OUM90436.1 MAG: hypothetical protein BAA00_18310 [Parageobacillus thermoglucosidasius]